MVGASFPRDISTILGDIFTSVIAGDITSEVVIGTNFPRNSFASLQEAGVWYWPGAN